MTLQLLWEEYKQEHPTGYGHSRFSELYSAWARRLDLVLRQDHRAGEKMFVDHAGQTVPVIDRLTGDTRDAYVFVAVLGASSYTYAEATWTRGLRDWISSHVHAFEFFQGCARLVVPDNWKSGVKQPCYYEPELNPTYNDLAVHYGVGILPARPYHARDKAKVEAGVQVVQRWVLAALRKRQFFSLAELNEGIRELGEKLNQRPFRKLPGTRGELYRSIDLPALRPLPAQPYVFAEWKRARVNIFCGLGSSVASSVQTELRPAASVYGGHITTFGSERLQEGHQPLVLPPVFRWLGFLDLAKCKCPRLGVQIDFSVDICGVDRHVTEPSTYRVDVHARTQQMGRGRVTNRMRADSLGAQRGKSRRYLADIALHQRMNAESGHGLTAPIQKDRFSRSAGRH